MKERFHFLRTIISATQKPNNQEQDYVPIASAYTRRIIALVVIWITIHITLVPKVAAQPHDEYQIKTAFLYNFAKFIDWPPTTLPETNAPFRFCIISKEPITVLNEGLHDRRIGKHTISLDHLRSPDDVHGQCQVLFIHRSTKREAQQIIANTGTNPTLLVGDEIDLARKGGDINFININNKIRFEINLKAVQSKGLSISSDMLKLALIVNSRKTTE